MLEQYGRSFDLLLRLTVLLCAGVQRVFQSEIDSLVQAASRGQEALQAVQLELYLGRAVAGRVLQEGMISVGVFRYLSDL
ncbi:hypothetical protein BKA67DRAFT_564679 [Truncatella angustata]|uniref:EAL domain-containing protein n=1 Tax=Truncatella angustata TaxID=152316 RepID=A0A9P8ULI0_9PEZI|nr:uncharacterized protein BKA67DRAFT_564679 [Truncatella angustata]KAH6654308.1 hypothetical protein BKA67DRAFT_564679 [Truncatella angustata]